MARTDVLKRIKNDKIINDRIQKYRLHYDYLKTCLDFPKDFKEDKSKYVEEFKNIIIVEKGTRTLEENNDESSDDEIVEIPESLKEQIQEEIKEQEDTIKEITIDDEALKSDSEEITIEEDKIDDDVPLEEETITEDNEEMKGGNDVKKIVVHSFF